MHRSSQQMEKGECFVLIEDTVYNARNLRKLFHYFMKEKTVLRHTEKKKSKYKFQTAIPGSCVRVYINYKTKHTK